MSELVSRRFSTEVGPGDDGELTTSVEKDATVEQIDVRFYPGPRLDLELIPFISTESGNVIELIDTTGREPIVGDNDVFEFYLSEPAQRGDTLGVRFNNRDPDHAYNFMVDMKIDRGGGLTRTINSVFK